MMNVKYIRGQASWAGVSLWGKMAFLSKAYDTSETWSTYECFGARWNGADKLYLQTVLFSNVLTNTSEESRYNLIRRLNHLQKLG